MERVLDQEQELAAMTVIGIDPGSQKTGWGVIRGCGSRLELLGCGLIRSPAEGQFSQRLAHIYSRLADVIHRFRPESAAIENVFMSKNPMSALKLGQARGVAVAACAAMGIEISDYSPAEVKQALVGSGRAAKEQVAYMVEQLLGKMAAKQPLDTTDALAAAICHLGTVRFRKKAVIM